MSFVGGLAGAGIGSALAMLVFAPLTAVNNFLGSYYFGSGMILGEREMYQQRWPEIKEQLDKGRSFIDVLEEVMKESTQGVMNTAERTLTLVKPQWEAIVVSYLRSIPDSVIAALRGDDIQRLIEALLGIAPFQEPGIEPPPSATPPPVEPKTEPTFPFTNDEDLMTMPLSQLATMRNDALLGLYSDAFKAAIIAAYNLRTDVGQPSDLVTYGGVQVSGNVAEEAAFLQQLLTVTLANVWKQYIPSLPSELQDMAISFLMPHGLVGLTSTRKKGQSSELTLTEIRRVLNDKRAKWISIQDKPESFDLTLHQLNVYGLHILIWVWQLIYK